MNVGLHPALALLHAESFSWTEWRLYPDFLLGWAVFFGLYLLAAGPLRRHFPGASPVPLAKIGWFSLGMLIMLLSLQGPLHDLSDYFLFSAHMVQHLLLILVMPPFLLAGVPGWMVRPLVRVRPLGTLARWLTLPLVAFALNNVIFAVWHFPGPYDLMMRNHDVHVAMHLMIMFTGMTMWWPVMSPLPELPRIAPPLQMVYLFVLGVPMMVIAAFITFSQTHLYTFYAEAPRIFGISPLDDQRLGGVIMWVPGALTIWLAITFVYFRWSSSEIRSDEQVMEGRARPRVGRSGLVVTPPTFPDRRV